MENFETILRQGYHAFNRRDVDGALHNMHPAVEWTNGMEGGTLHGQEEVRGYWLRQWEAISVHVEPIEFTRMDDGRIAVTVAMKIHDIEGNLLMNQQLVHLYTLENGKVTRMEITQSL